MGENKKISIICIIIIISILAIAIAVIFKQKTDQILQNKVGQNMSEISRVTNPIPSTQQVELNGDFATKFLQMENNKQNMVYSPLSIKYALNMLKDGAKGNTKAQIEKVVGNLYMPRYNSIDKTMSFANAIYTRDNYSQYIKDDYKNILMGKYNAEIKYDKFENAKNVNKWIEDKTLGVIKNMIKDEVVKDPNTKVLLINALAVDMDWESPFENKDTEREPFKLADGNIMYATTLIKETSNENITYYKDDNITSLTMPLKKYEDTQLEFTAIMPNENLEEYINNFTMNKFNDIKEELKPASTTQYGIEINIPKFKFEYDLKLKEDLIKMGITDAFEEDKADLTNMTYSPLGLYVDDALHKADIEFTEKGVKAAATTVIIAKDEATFITENKPIEIKFDKPFLYVITDKPNGEVWFLGTVYEPLSWEEEQQEYLKRNQM